ncbi:MAG: rod shape-determining protein MreC [Caulobacteraceae bacterium]|nr:rod shape-determining protein MreC [Caulobacteraceae bacterium]
MAFRQGQFGDVKVPLTWTAAAALIVAAIIAGVILFAGGKQPDQNDPLHKAADVVAAPVSGVVAAPVRWSGSLVGNIRGYFFAVSENRRLRADLAAAQQWKNVALSERDLNERYRALLGMKTDPPLPTVAALVVADTHGPFVNTRLANAGSDKGVMIGNPVMSPRGMIGRVIGVTGGVSRVLLLTDVVSQMPVMIDRTNARAILVGDGGANPRLDYLRGEPVKNGDRVVTSGDGGVVPRGLPIGAAAKGLDGKWRVRLDSDAEPIDYVQILLFKDFAQLADQRALAVTQMPPVITEDTQASMIASSPRAAQTAPPPAAAPSPPPATIAPVKAPVAPARPAATSPASAGRR